MRMKRVKGGVLLLAMGLSACGGGGGGGGVAIQAVQGKLTQGPVKQATIFADRLDKGTAGVLDADELSTTTRDDGTFTLNVPANYGPYMLVSKGGTDTITGKPAIQMMAPAGSANVTPLTTLVALAPPNQQQALKTKIETTGISFDADLSTAATPAALLLAKSVESTVETMAKTVETSGKVLNDTDRADIQQKTMQALATNLGSATSLANVLSLQSTISSAVASAVSTIQSAHTDITVSDTTAVASSISQAVQSVATAISPSGVFSTIATITETAALPPAAQTAIDNAIASIADSLSTKIKVKPTARFTNGTTLLTGVAIDASIKIVFSKAMDASTITASTLKINGVTSTVSYDPATRIATITPAAKLSYSTLYKVVVAGTIKDTTGITVDAGQLTFVTVDRPLTGSTGSSGSGNNF